MGLPSVQLRSSLGREILLVSLRGGGAGKGLCYGRLGGQRVVVPGSDSAVSRAVEDRSAGVAGSAKRTEDISSPFSRATPESVHARKRIANATRGVVNAAQDRAGDLAASPTPRMAMAFFSCDSY